MIYDQEIQAEKLYETLTRQILEPIDGSEISIEGIGVHWECLASFRERECNIYCLGSSGYAVSFNENLTTEAQGRTKSEEQVISAVINWLQNHDLNKIYKLFEFIDYDKRLLSKIADTFTDKYPDCVHQIDIKLNQNFGDSFDLELQAKDRLCKVYLWGDDKTPTYDFYWDGCLLFSCTKEDYDPLLSTIKLWLYDYHMPSQLEHSFPWLDTGKLAKYYEEGRGIEGEFILSWDHIEEFYRRLSNFAQKSDVLKLITQLREKGYDKTLRAGQSMHTFIVSRARRHGYMTKFISFDFHKNAMDVSTKLDVEENLSFPNIELTSQVEELIKQLEAQEMDPTPQFWR